MAVWIPLWMRGNALEQIYLDAWDETGSTVQALLTVQESDEYDVLLPGNRREDGYIRNEEAMYFSIIEGYEDAFESVGLSADFFASYGEGFIPLIEGNVSPDELYSTRLLPVWEDVRNGGDFVRAEYAEMWNIDLTDEAIMASILDPEGIGTGVLNRSIAQSEISGMAMRGGYDIDAEFRDLLLDEGELTRESADDLFSSAKGVLPILEVLRRRHTDSDDAFDIEEFANASVFRDPQDSLRMRRMLRAERASFSPNSSLTNARDQAGRIVGLDDS